MAAERVYVSLWVDQPPYHVHFVLQPRYPDHHHPQELGLKGLELQVFRTLGKPPLAPEMVEAAERIRTVWQEKFAPQAKAECEL
jgi:hypothetical protein